MKRFAAFGLAWLCWMMLMLVPRVALAQPARTDIQSGVDREIVSVGETVSLTLRVMREGESGRDLEDPQPGTTSGFSVLGQSVQPSTSISIINGVRSQKAGLTVTWTLRAEREGTFALGPPSVRAGGRRLSGQTAQIRVQRRGAQQPAGPRRPGPGWPFGPGADPFKGFFDDEPQDPTSLLGEPSTDPALALDAPRGEGTFFHAQVDKTRAFVGEQVTLKIYTYTDITTQDPDYNDLHEAPTADFVKHLLPHDRNLIGHAKIQGRIYAVGLVRRYALFPIKAGNLEIGAMTGVATRGRKKTNLESERIIITAQDTPAAGRPQGYASGDVGDFRLRAEVSPRETTVGGVVQISLELSGEGNLPAQLPMPTPPGVEFLPPEMHERIGVTQGDRLGGTRTFSYVVRAKTSGVLDLGVVDLPFYDVQRHRYRNAQAVLGTITVVGAAAAPVASAERETVRELPAPRTAREPQQRRRHLSDSPLFVAGLAASPLVLAMAQAGAALRRAFARRQKSRQDSPDRVLAQRHAEAVELLRGDDADAALRAVHEHLVAACVTHLAVNPRALTEAELKEALTQTSLDASSQGELLEVLQECEQARFTPGGVPAARPKELWDRSRALEKVLRKAGGAS